MNEDKEIYEIINELLNEEIEILKGEIEVLKAYIDYLQFQNRTLVISKKEMVDIKNRLN